MTEKIEWVKTVAYLCAILLVVIVITTRLAQSTDMTGIAYFEVADLTVAGDVYVAGSLGGVPPDAVLLFTTACPDGWTRLSAADDRYLRFGATAGATGGSATHTHTFSHDHAHTLSTSSSGGSHTHTYSDTTESVSNHDHDWTGTHHDPLTGGSRNFLRESVSDPSGSGGGHSHTIGPFTSGAGGSAHTHTLGVLGDESPTIGNANNDPPYVDFVLCKK